MKKQNMFKAILIAILVVVVLTWLIPTGTISGAEVISDGLSRIGIYELLHESVSSIEYFINVVLFIFGVGAFYGVLSKSEKYSAAVDKISKKLKGHGRLVVIITAIVFALLTSICGFNILAFALIPLVVAILLGMGYDRMVAFLTTFGATLIGTIGSIYNYEVTGIFEQVFGVTDYNVNIVAKIALLVVPLVVYLFFTDKYAESVKKSSTKSVLEEGKKDIFELVEKPKAKTTGMFVVLGLFVLVLLLAIIPWAQVFKIEFFSNITDKILSFKLGSHTIFKYILGEVPAFGTVGYEDVLILMLITAFVVTLMSKMSFNDFKEGLANGIKKTIVPGLVVCLAYTVLVLNVYYPIFPTISGKILGLAKNFNVFAIITTSLNAILASISHVDVSYIVQATTSLVTATYTQSGEILALIYQAMYGFTALFAPTSIMLILGLEYLNIPYKTWIKFAIKTILEILVVILVILIVFFLIG